MFWFYFFLRDARYIKGSGIYFILHYLSKLVCLEELSNFLVMGILRMLQTICCTQNENYHIPVKWTVLQHHPPACSSPVTPAQD